MVEQRLSVFITNVNADPLSQCAVLQIHKTVIGRVRFQTRVFQQLQLDPTIVEPALSFSPLMPRRRHLTPHPASGSSGLVGGAQQSSLRHERGIYSCASESGFDIDSQHLNKIV
jgi:hypothetical protein